MNGPAAQRIAEIREQNGSVLAEAWKSSRVLGLHGPLVVNLESLDVKDLLEVVDHVKDVLEEAERNNGGYGFVRTLLEYLG